MRKKLTAILVALTLVLALLPVPAAAVNASQEGEIREAVSAVIKAYAKKVYRADADNEAFDLFFKHGFYGNGADMHLTESSPMVSSLFNAGQMQQALTNSITKALVYAQKLQEDKMYVSGGINWHDYYYNYSLNGYIGDGTEFSKRLGALSSPRIDDGTKHYEGVKNENDSVMELLVGDMTARIYIRETETKSDSTVYELRILIKDYFDFEGSYTNISNKGYDTSKDDTLKDLGLLMTFMGLDEFNWDYTVTLQVEVKNYCDHNTGSYHWTYDGATATVSSENGNGYTYNNAVKTKYEYASTTSETGTAVKYYHTLEDTVVLKHDRPWVMEWDQKVMRNHQFSPTETSGGLPTIYSYGSTYMWFSFTRYLKLPEGQTTSSGSTYYTEYNYVGTEIKGQFGYKSKYTYTTILENVVNPDGSNMVYLTIYNKDLDEVVLGPVAMDDHWVKGYGDEERVLTTTESDYLNGQDIIINYLGNKSCGLSQSTTIIDIRLWENGKEPVEDKGSYVAPTCENDGGNAHTCPKCGYVWLTETEPALGHDYPDYTENNDATCTADGTKTRTCARCGKVDTVTIAGSALGHDFSDYISDGNITCTEDGTETRTCSRCAVTETRVVEGSATGHDFGSYTYDHNATCLEDGTKTANCSNCGATDVVPAEGSALGHNHKPTVTAPTCTEQGYTTYTCHCGDTYVDDYTDIIPHSEVIDPAVKSTCVTNGKTEGKHCEVCGLVTVKQKNLATSDHTWDEGVPSEQAGLALYTCIHCGATMESIATEPAPGFSDVPADAWYAAAVNWAKKQGITSGLTETLFGSDYACTRGQVVTFLWAAAGKPQPVSSENPFNDVSESDYYYTPVLWAVEKGITGGVGEGLFGPDQSCTRGQIVTFLWRAMNSPETTGESNFTDVSATDYFATPVQWAAENQVTGGVGNGMFGPNQTCTRAQVVTFLYKVYG